MTEQGKQLFIRIIERGAILLLVIALAVIMTWSSKEIKERRAGHMRESAVQEKQAVKPVISEQGMDAKEDAEFYFNKGVAFARAGSFDEAIKSLERAIEMNPLHYRAMSNLGLVYKNMFIAAQDPALIDKAIEMYGKALSVNPNFSDAYNNLGDAYFNQGKYTEAEKNFKEAIRLDPLNTNAYNNLGVALILQNKKEEALEYWRQSLKINPSQPRIGDYIKKNE
jgi:tetratricopeptide (TPR) repeat protein